MVNKVTFVGFTCGNRPNRPPGSAPALLLLKERKSKLWKTIILWKPHFCKE